MAAQIAVGKQSTVWDLHFSAGAGQSVQWLMIDKNEIAWLSTKLGFTATSSQFAELWTTDEDFKSVEVFRHSNHCFGMVRPVALLGNSFQIRSKSCWDSDQLRREDGISRKYLGGKPVMKMSFDYSKHTKAVTTNKLKPNRKIKNSYNLDKSRLVCLQ